MDSITSGQKKQAARRQVEIAGEVLYWLSNFPVR